MILKVSSIFKDLTHDYRLDPKTDSYATAVIIPEISNHDFLGKVYHYSLPRES